VPPPPVAVEPALDGDPVADDFAPLLFLALQLVTTSPSTAIDAATARVFPRIMFRPPLSWDTVALKSPDLTVCAKNLAPREVRIVSILMICTLINGHMQQDGNYFLVADDGARPAST
jgi:hypothetical protein